MRTFTNIVERYDRTIENKMVMNIDQVLGLRYTIVQCCPCLNIKNSPCVLYRLTDDTSSYGGVQHMQLLCNQMERSIFRYRYLTRVQS